MGCWKGQSITVSLAHVDNQLVLIYGLCSTIDTITGKVSETRKDIHE